MVVTREPKTEITTYLLSNLQTNIHKYKIYTGKERNYKCICNFKVNLA